MRKSGKWFPLSLTAVLLAVMLAGGCGKSPGRQAFEKAQNLEREAMLTKAAAEYERAHDLFSDEGSKADANKARRAAQSVIFIKEAYPDTREEVSRKLAEQFPDVPEEEREDWISSGELEHMTWDEELHYFEQAADNIWSRHLELTYQDEKMNQGNADYVRVLSELTSQNGNRPSWQPYSNPMIWTGTESVNVPRPELPEKGLLKLWFPLPVDMGGAQDSVSVLSVSPEAYLRQPPSITADLSTAYFEVPLDELTDDLQVSVQFKFTHYQTDFEVDPANVGNYDHDSPSYEQYTRSYGNTRITPEIRETAKEVAGGEKNPYLAARKLYDYVIEEIKYSFVPHETLWPRGEPESVYVHRMKRGDCGAQAMYFVSLCRSLGIPARTTGGWQLSTGNLIDHFWAEFFLPNYGWIPVDPTYGESANNTNLLTGQEKKAWRDFYFGHQDPLRCNVQLDVDLETVPPMDGEPIGAMAIQDPTGTCAEMAEPLSLLLMEYTTKSAELVSGAHGPWSGGSWASTGSR